MKKTLIAIIIATVSTAAHAIDTFTPLTAPANSGNTNEATNPFLLPVGWIANKVTDRLTLNNQAGFQSTFGSWDMINIGGNNNEFVYIPMEVGRGAGVVRYNRDTGISTTLLGGNNTNVFSSTPGTWSATNDDFVPSTRRLSPHRIRWSSLKNGLVMVVCSKSATRVLQRA